MSYWQTGSDPLYNYNSNVQGWNKPVTQNPNQNLQPAKNNAGKPNNDIGNLLAGIKTNSSNSGYETKFPLDEESSNQTNRTNTQEVSTMSQTNSREGITKGDAENSSVWNQDNTFADHLKKLGLTESAINSAESISNEFVNAVSTENKSKEAGQYKLESDPTKTKQNLETATNSMDFMKNLFKSSFEIAKKIGAAVGKATNELVGKLGYNMNTLDGVIGANKQANWGNCFAQTAAQSISQWSPEAQKAFFKDCFKQVDKNGDVWVQAPGFKKAHKVTLAEAKRSGVVNGQQGDLDLAYLLMGLEKEYQSEGRTTRHGGHMGVAMAKLFGGSHATTSNWNQIKNIDPSRVNLYYANKAHAANLIAIKGDTVYYTDPHDSSRVRTTSINSGLFNRMAVWNPPKGFAERYQA